MSAWIAFAWLCRALVYQRAGGTHFRTEVGDEGFLLAAGMGWLGLPMRAGDLDRLVVWIELDGEIARYNLSG